MKQTKPLKIIIGTKNIRQFTYFLLSIVQAKFPFYIKKEHIVVVEVPKNNKIIPIFISEIKQVNPRYVNAIFPMSPKRNLYSRLVLPEGFLKTPFPHYSRKKGNFLYLTYKE